MSTIIDIIGTSEFWYSVIRVTTPILFAALGALISDSFGPLLRVLFSAHGLTALGSAFWLPLSLAG